MSSVVPNELFPAAFAPFVGVPLSYSLLVGATEARRKRREVFIGHGRLPKHAMKLLRGTFVRALKKGVRSLSLLIPRSRRETLPLAVVVSDRIIDMAAVTVMCQRIWVSSASKPRKSRALECGSPTIFLSETEWDSSRSPLITRLSNRSACCALHGVLCHGCHSHHSRRLLLS